MHVPVLVKEIIGYLKIRKDFSLIDCTAGGGGHIKAVLKANPQARILGIDLDQSTLAKLKQEFGQSSLDQTVTLAYGSYANLESIAAAKGFTRPDAILIDLGFSSMQVDDPKRGFSFQNDGPLDMRFDSENELTAGKVLNEYPETKLTQIFKHYGEDNFAKKIASAIVRQRQVSPVGTTGQVLGLIENCLPKPVRHKAKDSARRIFQALRIEVNRELENLKNVLPQALRLLKPGGRLLVISFHSLEDRIVKKFFVEESRGCVCPADFPTCVCDKASSLKIITRKPIMASEQEIEANPRSKPAKLRVAEKINKQNMESGI